MTYYLATVHAYDVMGDVFVSVSARQTTADRTETTESLLHRSTTFAGTGESDPVEWTRDVLIAALEAL